MIPAPHQAALRTAIVLAAAMIAILSTAHAAPAAGGGWRSAPVVPKISKRMAERLSAQLSDATAHGNRAGVFAKVGDSITWSTSFLAGIPCGQQTLTRRFSYLQPTIDLFSRARFRSDYTNVYCDIADPFSRASVAAAGGVIARWATTPGVGGESCNPRETPVGCETRILRPAFALVEFGTNEASFRADPPAFRAGIESLVSALRRKHVIPILYTLPPRLDDPAANRLIGPYNQVLYELSERRGLLLINFRRALEGEDMIDRGMWIDGIHPNAPSTWTLGPVICLPVCQPFDFDPQGLRYGFNRRNLITLRTLNRLRLHLGLAGAS